MGLSAPCIHCNCCIISDDGDGDTCKSLDTDSIYSSSTRQNIFHTAAVTAQNHVSFFEH